MTDGSQRGRLLVATPDLADPNFARTVVLLLEHDEGGAVGLVLNRPSEMALDDVLPAWGPVAASPSVVFVGGPVQPDGALGLGRVRDDAPGDGPVIARVGRVGPVDLDAPVEDALVALDAFRLFAGYSGWGPGQLEGELASGGWIVVDAEPDDAMTDDPDALWRSVLRRQPGAVALLAAAPMDPSTN